jgi:hypothetical protein
MVSWVIHDGLVMQLRDGERAPQGSTPLEVPDDFLTDPERYVVLGDRLVERTDPEVEAAAPPVPLKLTQDEIAKLKAAIEEGRI